jgi:HEAT repeat protein
VALGWFLLMLAVLATALYASWNPLLEEWYLRGLDSADEETRLVAARRLGELRSGKAVPRLAGLVDSRTEPLQLAAIDALRRMGPRAEAAAPHLVRALLAPRSEAVWSRASEALIAIGPGSIPVVISAFPLLSGLHQEESLILGRFVAVLREMAAESVPLLGRELRGNASTRLVAFECLTAIGAPAAPALADLLGDEDETICLWAESALWKIGTKSEKGTWAVIETMPQIDLRRRRRLLRVLDLMGMEAMRSLERASGSNDEALSRAAIWAVDELH